MAKMTAQQIRAALKPMADFAPAVLRAAEIVEEAEAAERALAEIAAKKTALEKEIEEAGRRKAADETAAAEARRQKTAAEQETKARTEQLREELRILGNAAQAKRDAVVALDADLATAKKAKQQEVADEQKKLDDIKTEIQRMKKTILAA